MERWQNYKQQTLDGDWSLLLTDDDLHASTVDEVMASGAEVIPAAVPGNVELDLLGAGRIEEPFQGMNILKLREFERSHLWYWRSFEAEPVGDAVPVLVFNGIDCYADIFLNGEHIGSTDNMLIEHIFDVSAELQEQNIILVHIKPSELCALDYEYSPGLSAGVPNYSSLYVRKAPHMYGWDIMPRALSGGIWKSVDLCWLPYERFDEIYFETLSLSDDLLSARLRLHYTAVIADTVKDEYSVRIKGECKDSSFEAESEVMFNAGHCTVLAENVKVWQPAGRGEPYLYTVAVTLLKNGAALDVRRFNYGIRTVELVRTSVTDLEGSGEFLFKVNGEQIFWHGTNWVPLDAFHSRDPERTEQAVQLAANCGCNSVRCWGGNVYESDLFYDLCDQHGIMVWQDFAMACAIYPQDFVFKARLAEEARAVVRRLRHHPAIVMWAGDNECDMFYEVFRRGNPNQNRLTREVLPQVLLEEDPSRPYLPSSPYIDEEAFKQNAGHTELPENHLWGPRNYYKSDYYNSGACHFVSEIGYHGCPHPESLQEMFSEDKIWPWQDNAEWTLHSTSAVPGLSNHDSRVPLMATQISELFGSVPDNVNDYAFASQAAQAEAKKTFIEKYRGEMWRRTGILWWNLLDGWPQLSDAVVDYYWRKKLAYQFITAAQQPVHLLLKEPVDNKKELIASNLTPEKTVIEFSVRDIDAEEVIVSGKSTIPVNTAGLLATVPKKEAVQRFLLIEWTTNGKQYTSHYLAGERPFGLEQYRTWLTRAGLLDGEYGWMKK